MRSKAGAVATLILGIVVLVGATAALLKFGQLAIGLFVFPGIPLVLLWFAYRVFLRRLLRLRRLRNARERRELQEALMRDRDDQLGP